MWTNADNRPDFAIPSEHEYGAVILRRSPVDLGGLYHAFTYIEMRGMHDKLGRPYARVCNEIQKRIRGPQHQPVIHEVFDDKPCEYFGRHTRMYSGIAHMPSVPRGDIALFLEHELRAGIPRAMMGKSIFDLQSKLYRIITNFAQRVYF